MKHVSVFIAELRLALEEVREERRLAAQEKREEEEREQDVQRAYLSMSEEALHVW